MENVLKYFFNVGLLLMVFSSVRSQSVRVITFEDLVKGKTERKFVFTNPDSSREEIAITEMSIPADRKMRELAQIFQRDNYGRSSIWVEPRMIVIHSMDLGDLRNSLEQSSFLDRTMPRKWRTQIKAGSLPSGAHFIVDRDGTIYCLTPPSSLDADTIKSYQRTNHRWLIKRHLDANPFAIGIENVTRKDGLYDDLTHEQVISNAKLVRWLLWMEKGSITHIASHHQFNDRIQFDSMLNEFNLTLARPIYRAWTRKDVGDDVFKRISDDVRRWGWKIEDRFDAKD